MPADSSFHEYVKELFAGVGPIQIKRMFGGAGGYADGVMFLLLGDDTIHVKTDDALKAELREEGSGPFVFTPQNGPRAGEKIDLGYWRLPDSALDDPDEAAIWGRKALNVAKAKAAARPPKKAADVTKVAPKKAKLAKTSAKKTKR
ncbi:MAG: TfoX/Sxy family protein [Hyphomonadaceae bacterium]|nr:TfoX/Sxy family protein [Hyphomonadaceae bacterium]